EIPEPAPTDLSLQRQMPSGESSDEVQGMRFLGRSSQLASEEDSSSFEQSSLSHAERQEFSFGSGELSAAVDCIPLPSKTSGSLAEDADTKRLNVRADGPPYLYASRHTLSTLPTETEQPALLSGGLLASARLESVLGWGMVHDADMYVIRPSTVEQLQQIFAYARREGRQVTLRGSGQSYGDASIGRECILTDLSRMKRILSWSPQTGIVDLEPGVRIMDLWRYTLEDGWWPPVVSGTMKTSFGGGLGVNIHGKNSYKYGTLGEHILELDVLTPDGKMHLCTPQIQPELFYSVIGSGGLLGVITRIRLRMKRVYSGNLCVHARSTPSLTEMRNVLEANLDQDYLVGWVDTLARGRQLGRGTLHLARYLNADEDPTAHATLKQKAQEIPDTVLGVVPKSMLWMGLWMFLHETGMRWVNRAKFYADQREEQRGCYMQSHAAFNFLLDYVPGWQRSYRPGGLIQYQTFVPKEVAVQVFEEQLCWSLEAGCPPFLGVFKKHRVDPFLLSYNVDGYSFALDYPVRKRTERRLQKLLRKMTERVLEKGGRFYLAKDGILLPEEYKRAMPEQILQKLRTLKRTFDPQGILVSELARRLELLSKR
ncbi:MAG: FAD-binding oxidoreductase, partial [Myxococcota bacterium]